MKEHRRHTATFDDLNYADQAKSITAQVNALNRSIVAHTRRAAKEKREPSLVKIKCIAQIARLIDRLSRQ